ncbi:dCMP deaminase family protein [Bradyrhizobium sp. 139]|uniref:deoxycytidylate deaminase n=1 Tax=Bradyrhizobium sp. 139 TaxID=2782616 RepID=UPI001FF91881|nr:dCMP deaminase family protein [Bradyrhizobium sp. 139]MCK1741374.1 dCMP deaminase family protein [Bradyrhizobium sp. 139]
MDRLTPLWRTRFLALARNVGAWSKDPSTKVGAVIVRPDRTVVAVGYNGFPRGTFDREDYLADRPEKIRRTVHAELNAILTAREPLQGCTLFVTPLHPCAGCAGAIIQSGIKRVVAELAKPAHASWLCDFDSARRMFDESDVEVELVTPELVTPEGK